jgi:hypothetical protein
MNVIIRRADETDEPRLSEWIAKDAHPQHRGVPASWWTTGTQTDDVPMGTQCFAVENAAGPIFYLKIENVMRCYIQFPPDVERDKEITSLALASAFKRFAAGAKQMGYTEIIFDSQSRGLVNLFTRLGFSEVRDNFSVRI